MELWNNLINFIKQPESEEAMAKDFEQKWQFPHCIGVVDGKHVNIQAPPNSGTLFYNYKNFHSMVFMTVADANYSFMIVNVGNGQNCDSTVISNTDFGKALASGSIKLPNANEIQNINLTLPYVFVSDEAFPLKSYMMRPYSARDLNLKRRIFSYRLNRARRIVENEFGILLPRFRILR